MMVYHFCSMTPPFSETAQLLRSNSAGVKNKKEKKDRGQNRMKRKTCLSANECWLYASLKSLSVLALAL